MKKVNLPWLIVQAVDLLLGFLLCVVVMPPILLLQFLEERAHRNEVQR